MPSWVRGNIRGGHHKQSGSEGAFVEPYRFRISAPILGRSLIGTWGSGHPKQSCDIESI